VTEPLLVLLAAGRYRLDPSLVSTDYADFQAALDDARAAAGDDQDPPEHSRPRGAGLDPRPAGPRGSRRRPRPGEPEGLDLRPDADLLDLGALLRTSRLPADTGVVPAGVSCLADAGLLAKAIQGIAATGRRIQAAGGATRTGCGTAAARRGSGGRRCRCTAAGACRTRGRPRRWARRAAGPRVVSSQCPCADTETGEPRTRE
jgi:hypothetical protein